EQERLDRQKHSHDLPLEAMRFCLKSRGATLGDLAYVAYDFEEEFLDTACRTGPLAFRSLITDAIRGTFESDFDPARIVFVPHHVAHGPAAYAMSGFDDALVVTLDGRGESDCGVVIEARREEWGPQLSVIESFDRRSSLGTFYTAMTRRLGFD